VQSIAIDPRFAASGPTWRCRTGDQHALGDEAQAGVAFSRASHQAVPEPRGDGALTGK